MTSAMTSRLALIAIGLSLGTLPAPAAPAQPPDPYRWCAHYSGEGGGGVNCYFMTLEQCRWTISGAGGYCAPNPFYTGPAEGAAPRTKPRR